MLRGKPHPALRYCSDLHQQNSKRRFTWPAGAAQIRAPPAWGRGLGLGPMAVSHHHSVSAHSAASGTPSTQSCAARATPVFDWWCPGISAAACISPATDSGVRMHPTARLQPRCSSPRALPLHDPRLGWHSEKPRAADLQLPIYKVHRVITEQVATGCDARNRPWTHPPVSPPPKKRISKALNHHTRQIIISGCSTVLQMAIRHIYTC